MMDVLRERNAQFADRQFVPGLTLAPTLRTIVIGCVDPRVDPAHVLGLDNGEAAVLRNVGGRVVPATVQALGMLGALARVEGGEPGTGWNLVVLHHTDCGITRLANNNQMLGAYFGIPVEAVVGKQVSDPYASVAVDIDVLKANPNLPGGFVVSGLVYDVATGRVATVVPAALPRGERVTP